MTTVSNNSQNNPAYSIDEAVKQSVNVSDATQLENNFLTLMVAQIQNQDPTKPVDNFQYVQQMAMFAQVEGGSATNAKLDAVIARLEDDFDVIPPK